MLTSKTIRHSIIIIIHHFPAVYVAILSPDMNDDKNILRNKLIRKETNWKLDMKRTFYSSYCTIRIPSHTS